MLSSGRSNEGVPVSCFISADIRELDWATPLSSTPAALLFNEEKKTPSGLEFASSVMPRTNLVRSSSSSLITAIRAMSSSLRFWISRISRNCFSTRAMACWALHAAHRGHSTARPPTGVAVRLRPRHRPKQADDGTSPRLQRLFAGRLQRKLLQRC